ncbi:hypothetical protein M3664_03875 [Paenibacillus lautus]|uniref:hypothetical protein n=1 Tax=Bacillales TaxID=1385 RepID=UPI00203B59EE|nr:hypothetical protein [Paenibacillus lautus]MCM3256917.1 hypothetical protein [Paenibacillus lautus]
MGAFFAVNGGRLPSHLEYVLRDLLHAAGFQEVTRYFGAFLVEGWFAIKAWLSLL